MSIVNKKLWNQILMTIIGSILFCVGLNLFVTPMGLYAGGGMGIAQIIRTLLANAGIHFNFEISGLINLMINIPLMVIAYKSISKRFFCLTLISVLTQTIASSLIPVVNPPILGDILTNVIVGGIISGFGIGLVLRSSACGGGIDVLGFYLTQNFPNISVGKVSIAINAVLYTVCMLLFNMEIAIYSILNTVVFSFVVDKIHYQNISVTAMIFSREESICDFIMQDLHRGVTMWKGYGAYTKNDSFIFVTAVSKYEINHIKTKVKEIDPKAFIIFSESMSVIGNFEKHL